MTMISGMTASRVTSPSSTSLDSHAPLSPKSLPAEWAVFSGFLEKRYRWILYL
jgi:hypothetical protein